MDTLEPQKDTSISKDLKEEFSDLLFKVNINEREKSRIEGTKLGFGPNETVKSPNSGNIN